MTQEETPGGAAADALPPRKRIVIFSAQYLPHTGGVENYTYQIARRFEEMGAHAIVVALANCGGAGYEVDDAGFEVFRLPCKDIAKSRYPMAKSGAEYDRAFARIDAQGGADYVIVNTRFYPHSVRGARFARQRGITPVFIEHGSAHLTVGNALVDKGVEAVEHAMTRQVAKEAPVFYAVSKAASAWLGHFGQVSCGELPNSIDAADFRAMASSRDFRRDFDVPEGALLVAFSGRFVPEKGIGAVLGAARALEREGERVFFVLAGGDSCALAPFAKTGGIPRNVAAAGLVSRTDMAALMTQADAFCLPSRSEGFSSSLLEAAACGACPVITDVGGAREVICDEEHGIILSDASADAVAGALRGLARDRERCRAMGNAARARVEETLSWSKTARAALAACEQANPNR